MEGAVLSSKSPQPNKGTSGYSFQVRRPQTMTWVCMHTYCGSPQICNPGHIVQSQYKPHLQRVQPWDTWACILCPVLGLHHSYLYIPTTHPAPVTSFLGHSRKPGGAEGELAQESSFLCAGSKTEEGARKPEPAGGHMMPAQASDASCRAGNLCLS